MKQTHNEEGDNVSQSYYCFYIQVKTISDWFHPCNSQPGILSIQHTKYCILIKTFFPKTAYVQHAKPEGTGIKPHSHKLILFDRREHYERLLISDFTPGKQYQL